MSYVCLAPGELQLCLCLTKGPIDLDRDPWIDFLAWLWACLVTMDLPSDHWAVSSSGYCHWTCGLTTCLDLRPALSPQTCLMISLGWTWPPTQGLSCLPCLRTMGHVTCLVKPYPASYSITLRSSPFMCQGQELAASWHTVCFCSSSSLSCVDAIIWICNTKLKFTCRFAMFLSDCGIWTKRSTKRHAVRVGKKWASPSCAFISLLELQLCLLLDATHAAITHFYHSKSFCHLSFICSI